MRPLLDLSERLGRLAFALADGPIERVDVRYAGGADDGVRPLTAAALVGLLEKVVGKGAVNFVNVDHIAGARGIAVNSTRLARHVDYAEYVEIEAWAGGESVRTAGALLGTAHPRIVRIGEFRVDVRPRGVLLILRNHDVPGVIGRVGSALGSAMINIAEYHQARLEKGGEALAAVSVDGMLDDAILKELRSLADVIDVRQVELM
jgi:D-3-phosphoglycerate dehydrogenase